MESLEDQCDRYAKFVSQTLKPEYETAQSLLQTAQSEVDGYQELLRKLNEISSFTEAKLEMEDTKTTTTEMVDLGYQTLYCRAVASVDKIFVHVGMGFHIELEVHEAKEFVQRRLDFLRKEVVGGRQKKVQEISTHVQEATTILNELQRELQS